MIAPPGALFITIQFTNISTQASKDIVQVFQCSDTSCTQQQLLADLSGMYAYKSNEAIISTTGFMKVVFTSDSSLNYDGFTALWSSVSMMLCSHGADVSKPEECLTTSIEMLGIPGT